MRRLAIALCGLFTSVAVSLSTPATAEARPFCPRGSTFTYCIWTCPASNATLCASMIGVYINCPVDESQSDCGSDAACALLYPDSPEPPTKKLTCTWYP